MRSRRRRYITNSGFQWRFTLGFCITSLITSTLTGSLFYYFSTKQLEALMWSVHIKASSASEILTPLFFQINLLNLVFIATLLIITSRLMLHKIRNPIYRLIRGIQTMKEGDFSSHIILRQRDEFKDVAQTLENMRLKSNRKYRLFAEKYEKISTIFQEIRLDDARGLPIDEKKKITLEMIKELKMLIS